MNILQIGEGQTCFIRNWGRVTVFFAKKNYSMSVSSLLFVNKHAKCLETRSPSHGASVRPIYEGPEGVKWDWDWP